MLVPPTPFDRMVATIRTHRSVTGTLRGVAFGKEATVRFRFLAPDGIDIQGDDWAGRYLSDGKDAWVVFPVQKAYMKSTPDSARYFSRAAFGYCLLLDGSGNPLDFYRPAASDDPGVEEIGLNIPGMGGRTHYPTTMTVLFDPKSGLPLGMRAGSAGDYRYEDIRLDPPLSRDSFHFHPPAGYREIVPAKPRPVRPLASPLYPQRQVVVGEWTSIGALRVRVGKPRASGGSWFYDVEVDPPGACDLADASATAGRGGEWRIANLAFVRDGGRRAVIGVDGAEWPTPPDSLLLNLTLRDATTRRALTLVLGR